MKVTFLGTGTSQGVPMIGCDCEVCRSNDRRDKRLRSSVHIDVDGLSIVIDTTPDFRYQMLRENIRSIDAVLYTHDHRDHTAGMDDLRAYNYLNKRAVPVYCTKYVAGGLEKSFAYAFEEDPYPGVPQVKLNIIDGKTFKINNLDIIPIKGRHFIINVMGFRVKNFAYLTDFDMIYEDQFAKLEGLDVLVINALRLQPHKSHFALEQALEMVARINPKRAFLTHMSHQIGLYENLIKTLPENVFPAYDGLKIEL